MKQIDPVHMLGYNPSCSIYFEKKSNMWFINYKLPNSFRMRRKAHKKRSEANIQKGIKERQLSQGNFDDKDVSKMPELFKGKEKKRYKLMEALTLYLDTTSGNRKEGSQYNDKLVLTKMFEYFQRSRKYLDEVEPLDVQLLFRKYKQEKKKKASLNSYRLLLSKVFNWFINDIKKLEGENPVNSLPKYKKSDPQLVRERLATEDEVYSILNAPYVVNNRFSTPIQAIVKFLIYTGARTGEVLHLEWEDIDFETGMWDITFKSNCQTKYGKGWSPKWDKPRIVPLFPEAFDVLYNQPRVSNFVFPKSELRVIKKKRNLVYSRIDNISKAWKTLRINAGIENLQLKDLRTYFNWILINRYHFTHKEAGNYIGNSKEVNEHHYTPVELLAMQSRMDQFSLSEAFGFIPQNQIN